MKRVKQLFHSLINFSLKDSGILADTSIDVNNAQSLELFEDINKYISSQDDHKDLLHKLKTSPLFIISLTNCQEKEIGFGYNEKISVLSQSLIVNNYSKQMQCEITCNILIDVSKFSEFINLDPTSLMSDIKKYIVFYLYNSDESITFQKTNEFYLLNNPILWRDLTPQEAEDGSYIRYSAIFTFIYQDTLQIKHKTFTNANPIINNIKNL
jgi:hypothetical protein